MEEDEHVTVLKLATSGSFVAVKGREDSHEWYDIKGDLSSKPDPNVVEALLIKRIPKIKEEVRAVAFQKGVTAYGNFDDEGALRQFRALAQQGHVDAHYYLALMYKEGRGVQEDFDTALKWLRLPVTRGHAKALELKIEIARVVAAQKEAQQRAAEEAKRQAA